MISRASTYLIKSIAKIDFLTRKKDIFELKSFKNIYVSKRISQILFFFHNSDQKMKKRAKKNLHAARISLKKVSVRIHQIL